MAKTDKLTKKFTIIGIVLAVVVVLACWLLKLPPKSMFSGLIVVWAVIIVIRMYTVNGRNKEYSQMLEHLNKILTEDNDPEKYVKKCNDYSNRVEDEAFKEMLKVNSATGYACMCKYDEALEVLKSADLSLLNPSHKMLAVNNIAQYSYFLGKNEEASKCVDENFQNMQKYLDNKSFSAAFMTTFAFYYYFKGNKYKAQKYTDKVIEFINNSGSTSEGDMTVLSKLKELKEKVDAMPNPEEIYGDDDK